MIHKNQIPAGAGLITDLDLRFRILTATAANSQEQTIRQAIYVPLTLRWASEFKTAPWAHAVGLGRWRNN